MIQKIFFLIALVLLPSQLWARDFQICSSYKNQKVYVAYGYQANHQWHSQGWFMVRPGRCLPFAAPIEGGSFYYFAYNENKSIKYDGKQPFCVDSKPFRSQSIAPSPSNCEAEGLMIRFFSSFKLKPKTSQTRLILEPPQGPETKPIPYPLASIAQLKQWAAQGDANAKAELSRRPQPRFDPVSKPAPNQEDLKAGPNAKAVDKGAFEVN